MSLQVRPQDPESRAPARWSPGKDSKVQSDMKPSDTNMLEDIVEGFSKAR